MSGLAMCTRLSVKSRAAIAGLCLAAWPVGLLAQQAAVPDAWVAPVPKASVLSLKDPDGRFTLEYPRRDWSVVPGAGPIVATVVHKKMDTAILVEVASLAQPLGPDDITDLFAELESDLVRERQPKATDFQTRLLQSGPWRLVAIQFVRPGTTGMERIRQFSIPVGQRLYRISCVAALGSFAASERWFAHAVATFTASVTE